MTTTFEADIKQVGRFSYSVTVYGLHTVDNHRWPAVTSGTPFGRKRAERLAKRMIREVMLREKWLKERVTVRLDEDR